MVDNSVDPTNRGVDINALYSPATAATEVEPQNASEEAALGRSGANSLLAVTIIEFVGTTVVFFLLSIHAPDPSQLVFAYGIVAVFAGLYIWARANPYPACIAGLALYLTIHLLAALSDPASLYHGIVVKVVVISVLAGSIRNIQRFRAANR